MDRSSTESHKRPRKEPILQYSTVLAATGGIHKSTDENSGNADQFFSTGVYHEEILPLDPALLSYYNVPPDQAECLSNLLQTQFIYGNTYIRNALTSMVFSMLNKVQEYNNMQRDYTALIHDNNQLKNAYQALETANETLEAESQTASELQNKLEESQKRYDEIVEASNSIQADIFRLSELEHENITLKSNLVESKQKISQLDKELKAAHVKVQSGLEAFKDASLQFSFPVMQNNGHVVDFHRIIPKWAKAAEEDETTSSRTFPCSITKEVTRLANFPITDRIQRIAIGLGLKVEPPLVFERRVSDIWTPLSTKSQIQLTAMVCYLYANRKRQTTADTVADAETISFRLSKVC